MKIYTFLLLIFLFLLVQCTNHEKQELTETNKYFKDFPKDINLKGSPIEIKSSSFANFPTSMWKIDSILILVDSKTENKNLHFLDLNNKKYLFNAISKGNGPGELTAVSSIVGYALDKPIYAHDLQTQKAYELSIDSLFLNPNYIPTKYFNTMGSSNKLKSRLQKLARLNDSTLIGEMLPAYDGRFMVYDNDFKEKYSFGEYPPIDWKGRTDSLFFSVMVQGNIFQGSIITVPSKGFLIMSHPYLDLIEVFDVTSGKELVSIIGPEQNYPPEYEGDGIPCKTCKSAYDMVQYNNGYIFAIYSGKEHGPNFIGCSYIFQFDIKGNPICKYTLDYEIIDFILDLENNKIYGLALDEDKPIIEFEVSI